MPDAKLVSVNVGLPRDITWRGETVRTAIWKQPVQGRRMVRRLNVDGDGQGDLAGHGGEHRAVMVYQLDSYRYWQTHLGRNGFLPGQFGENFTVEGLADNEVCVGDRYRIGGALFEVTQPRVTCYRVGIRMSEPSMPALLVSHHRPGFYFRVLEEGEVGAGDRIEKVLDGPERISVADIDALLYLPAPNHETLQSSLRIPALSTGWQESLKAILTRGASETGNPGLSTSAGRPPAWVGFRPLRVTKIEPETSNVVSFSFHTADGSPLPPSLPGQFLVLRLRVAPDLPAILRNYSISGVPGATAYRVSVKREVNGAGSSFLHDHVRVGDVLEVSAPRGTFILQSDEGPVVLVSAGIGATPVLSMLLSLAENRSPREIWWLHGARNRTLHPFAKEVREALNALDRAKSHVVYSQPDPDDQPELDYDSVGHLDVARLNQMGVPQNADFYLCGPPAFLRSFTSGLREWGAQSSHIRSEIFGPEEPINPGMSRPKHPVHPPSGAPGFGPQVSFTRSGLTVRWNSRFLSLLEFAEACAVPVKWSCRTGVCHTCECALIGGVVDYQPELLEMPAEGNILICCSRPNADIEIDL